jgi:N-terminal region of Chorein or VPS13
MASYIINPSRKISEILAQFLEFDSKQLHFGIWSGDLTISNVKLKEDAFSSFLNSSNVTPESNKEPLQLKLVRGKVGHIRLKIPWKSLVWGQEPVRLFISDIDIVFSYESRDEARRRPSRRKSSIQHNDISNEGSGRNEEGIEIHDELLEQKYLWLEEAETRLLRGLPLQEPFSPSAANQHQKNVQEDSGSKGFFASLVDQMKTSLGMNAAAGLQAEIRNVRITIQQGDIEIGCMLRGLELNSPTEREGSTNTETSNLSSCELNKSTTGHPSNNRSEKNKQIQRESEPDFWKIDKELLIFEFAMFLRKFDPLVSPELHSFIKLSDLILTPTKIVIPITYISPRPFHKENSKKMLPHHHIDMSSQAETSFSHTNANKMEGKRRRGKREKINDIPLNDLHKTSEAAFCYSPAQDKRQSSVESKLENCTNGSVKYLNF